MAEISVYHFTSELFGGAGVAAQRLHAALSRQNVKSHLYYDLGMPLVDGCTPAYQNRGFLWRNVAALAQSWRHRRNRGFVTDPRWIRKTPMQALGGSPKVINLHWVSRWIDLPSFFASLPAGQPVVWSLHDMNPFTGGCHHAGECSHFTDHCGHCPQVKRSGARDDAYRFFQIKARCYEGLNLHFVGNSEWTTAQARRSALARHVKSFHTIPLGINTEEFRPVDQRCARQALGLADNRFIVGFGCADFNDLNKGGALLIEALRALASQMEITLLTFGTGRLPAVGNGVQVVELGALNSPRLQSLFYSAADVFAAPSKIESFGLTALEAMACGTPVVAFRTSGLIDVVSDGETGLLEPKIGNVEGLTSKLQWLMQNPVARKEMGLQARQRAEAQFTDGRMAREYAELYKDLTLKAERYRNQEKGFSELSPEGVSSIQPRGKPWVSRSNSCKP